MMAWIKVTDRMPPDKKPVIVTVNDRGIKYVAGRSGTQRSEYGNTKSTTNLAKWQSMKQKLLTGCQCQVRRRIEYGKVESRPRIYNWRSRKRLA